MANTAFEAITTRQAWYASQQLDKYTAVMLGTDGKYTKADGTRPFAGIVQYPADKAGDMCTVVRGTFPGIAAEAITAGAYVKVDAGKLKVGDAATAIGIALTAAAAANELVAVSMLETPAPVPKAS